MMETCFERHLIYNRLYQALDAYKTNPTQENKNRCGHWHKSLHDHVVRCKTCQNNHKEMVSPLEVE